MLGSEQLQRIFSSDLAHVVYILGAKGIPPKHLLSPEVNLPDES